MKRINWIRRVHPYNLDEYICPSCRASYAGPHASCPCCGRFMWKTEDSPLWINETDIRKDD